MAGGLRVGLDAKLYRNTGTYAVPTWTLIPIVVDVTQDIQIGKAEVKARLSTWAKTLPTHKSGPLEFKMVKDTSDANYAALRDAALGRTIVDFAIADDAIATTGTEYIRSEFYLYGFKNGQPIDGVNVVDVSADVAAGTANDPIAVTVGS